MQAVRGFESHRLRAVLTPPRGADFAPGTCLSCLRQPVLRACCLLADMFVMHNFALLYYAFLKVHNLCTLDGWTLTLFSHWLLRERA